MTLQEIEDEVVLKLTGDVVDFELCPDSLDKIVKSAFRELQRYIDSTKLITIPFKPCIDLTEYKVSSVSAVFRTAGFVGDTSPSPETGYIDPLYASQWQLLSGVGNLKNFSDYAYNYAAWNTLLQIRNTSSTDLAFRFDKSTNFLYVNISSNPPTTITVEYVPQYEDVSEIKSDYWIDMLIRLSVAIAKVTVGRVRSKFTQSNSLWTLDGASILAEGTEELKELREQLTESSQLVYPID